MNRPNLVGHKSGKPFCFLPYNNSIHQIFGLRHRAFWSTHIRIMKANFVKCLHSFFHCIISTYKPIPAPFSEKSFFPQLSSRIYINSWARCVCFENYTHTHTHTQWRVWRLYWECIDLQSYQQTILAIGLVKIPYLWVEARFVKEIHKFKYILELSSW